MVSKATLAAALELAPVVENDPVWFVQTILGHDPWEVPRAILRAIQQPRARVAVKACHASSKTFTAAEVVLWWVACGGIAVTTAPTWTQVRRLLWGEIHQAYIGARFPLGGTLLQTEWRVGPANYAIGLSTNEGVNFQGFHGRVLIVLDEAPGVRPDVWEAIEGIRAGGDVRILAIGNPTDPTGPFADAFSKDRSGWTPFTIDALETPNLDGLTIEQLLALPDDELDIAPRPYLTTRRWVVEKYHEWGEQSPLWAARVRGQFPAQAEDALISLAWLEAAQVRELTPAADDAWEAGVDVAGPGEAETVLAIRHGPCLQALYWWAAPDPRGDVLAALAPWQDRVARVKVDSIGQGHYFARHLEDNGWRGKVVDINVGEASGNRERYANLKAELYWGLRDRLQAGELAGLTDDQTVSQLASIRYRHTPQGKLQIESKAEALKRGIRSPDRAEAIMLAFAPRPEVATVQVWG